MKLAEFNHALLTYFYHQDNSCTTSTYKAACSMASNFQTEKTYNMHLNGRGHAKKLRQLSLHPTGTPPTTQTPDNSLQELSAELESSYETSGQKQRFCLPCQVRVVSEQLLTLSLDYFAYPESNIYRFGCAQCFNDDQDIFSLIASVKSGEFTSYICVLCTPYLLMFTNIPRAMTTTVVIPMSAGNKIGITFYTLLLWD